MIPERNQFEQNIISLYGDRGRVWLNDLPIIIEKILKQWDLRNLKPVENLSYNYVLTGIQHEQPVVLKLNPKPEDLNLEIAALKAFAGYGVVDVLEQTDGAILLERAVPGYSLRNYFPYKDEQAIQITCKAMQKLHQAPIPRNTQFPHIADWLKTLDKNWDIPKKYLERSRLLRNQLLETLGPPVFLHGDLHHDNILENGDGWRVIDPKGVIGETAYEVAAFIRNPIPELLVSPESAQIIPQRIKTFARLLNLDENRIQQWCFVQAILAWIWCLEDGTDPNYFKRLTEVLDRYS